MSGVQLSLQDNLLHQIRQDAPRLLLPNGRPYRREEGGVVSDSIDETNMTASFVVVTRRKSPNRNGHTVQIIQDEATGGAGIMLDNYAKNPQVWFDHGFNTRIPLSIGVAEINGKLSWRGMKTKAESTVKFSQSNEDAGLIFAMVAEGIYRTASISFLPLLAVRNEVKERKTRKATSDREVIDVGSPWASYDFIENDLLEWSVVGVPADPDAVRKCLDRGSLHDMKVSDNFRHVLKANVGDEPAWSPGWSPIESDSSETEEPELISALQNLAGEFSEQFGVLTGAITGLSAKLDSALEDPVQPAQPTTPTPEPTGTGQAPASGAEWEGFATPVDDAAQVEEDFDISELSDRILMRAESIVNQEISPLSEDVGSLTQMVRQHIGR